jgi:hypothetical protein
MATYSLQCCQPYQGFSAIFAKKIRPLGNNSAAVGKPHNAELKIQIFTIKKNLLNLGYPSVYKILVPFGYFLENSAKIPLKFCAVLSGSTLF